MGNQRRPYPVGRYRLNISGKKSKDKAYPIMLEYSFGGIVRRKSIGLKARESDWNAKGDKGRGELKASFGVEYKRQNAILQKKVNEIDMMLFDYNEKHRNGVNIKVIEAILNGKPLSRKDEGKDFCDFVEERLMAKYNLGKISVSRRDNGKSCMNQFKQFLRSENKGTYKEDGLYLGELKPELIESFIEWKRDVKGNKTETINQCLAPIICALEYASDMGYVEKSIYAHVKEMRVKEVEDLDGDSDKFDGKYLTKEQMQQLLEFYEQDSEPRRKDFIEIFLFAFHCCGIRASDAITLQWSHLNLEKREMEKVMVKTKSRLKIPLNDAAMKILLKWKKEKRRERYVFDLVRDDLDLNDKEALYKARNSAVKCLNQALKVVGEKLEFPFSLTMHKARHTFACMALNDGMSMTVVGRLLGHSDTSVTERVYAMFLPQKLEEEVMKLNYNYLPSDIK